MKYIVSIIVVVLTALALSSTAQAQAKEHIQCHGISDTVSPQAHNVQIHSPFYSGNATLQHPAMVCNAAKADYNNMQFNVATLNKSWMCYDFGTANPQFPATDVAFVSNINGTGVQSLATNTANLLCLPSRLHYSGSADGPVPPSSPVTAPGDAKICHHTTNDATTTIIEVSDRLGSNVLTTKNTHTACLPARVKLMSTGQVFTPADVGDSWSCYDRVKLSSSNIGNFSHSNAMENGSKTTGESKLICSTGLVYDLGGQGHGIVYTDPLGPIGTGNPLTPLVGRAPPDPVMSPPVSDVLVERHQDTSSKVAPKKR